MFTGSWMKKMLGVVLFSLILLLPLSARAADETAMSTLSTKSASKSVTFNSGGKTLEDVLGVNRGDLLAWLGSHVNDNYYLGTAYGYGDNRNPNGDTAGYGYRDKVGVAAMNCTGFVWHALKKAGANSKTPAISGWYTLLVNNKMEYRTYYNTSGIATCINTMLTDGYIEPGDLVWVWDSNCSIKSSTGMPTGTSGNHHIGIYIGDYFDSIKSTTVSTSYWQMGCGVNRWWHSSDHKASSNFDVDGNQSSVIVPKVSCNAITVVKCSKSASASIEIESTDTEFTAGNSVYSLKNAEYGVYSDLNCTKQVATFTTDENGESNIIYLKPGKNYYVKETKTPTGYVKDTKIRSIWITAKKHSVLSIAYEPQYPELSAEQPFVDVSSKDYYYDAVLWAMENEITQGTDTIHFRPQRSATRAQVVTFLWRASGCPEVEGENKFVDINDTDYYYDAVSWAVEQGITEGTDETHFSPNSYCTRAQMVTFQYRANNLNEEVTEKESEEIIEDATEEVIVTNPFVDVDEKAYYYEAVLWAVARGITRGKDEIHFAPDELCTRAQAVTFLYRAQSLNINVEF